MAIIADGSHDTSIPLFPDPPPAGAAGAVDPADSTWLDVLPAQADVLRDYQRKLLERAARAMRKHRNILLQSPTGSGKTHLISTIVAAAEQYGMRVLVLATRSRLVKQLHERLCAFRIEHGVLAAALPTLAHRYRRVQVASVDTLYRRCIVDEKHPLPPADVVIFDEAHLALGDSRHKILEAYPGAWLFGFTATPAKTSGRPLSGLFSTLILGPSVSTLIELGMLVRPRVFNAPVVATAELQAVSTNTGDYAVGQLASLLNRPKLVGDVVQNWLRIANGRKTLVFACDKPHGAQLTAEFLQAGISAEQITDDDDEDARERCIARLERGDTQVLINCTLMSYGVDIPAVDCVVLARPTRSLVLYLQAIGRGMRPATGKSDLIVIDHGRVVETLGMPTDAFGWTLGDGNVNKLARDRLKSTRVRAAEKPCTCGECAAVWLATEAGNRCPECGWKPLPRPKAVQVDSAELREITAKLGRFNEEIFRQALGFYIERWPHRWAEKPNSGRYWAWMQAHAMFGQPAPRMPSHLWSAAPATPTPMTAGWLKSRLIAFAKGRGKSEQRDAAA